MTISQQARLTGIHASIKYRGVSVSLGSKTFNALVTDAPPDASQFTLSNETRSATFVFILREDLGATEVEVGHVFHCVNGCNYRVVEIEPRPSDILAAFKCESVRP